MTERDTELARQAGLHMATDVNWMPIIGLEYAKRFADLIRADEREACIDLVAMYGGPVDLEAAIRARGR